MNHIALEAEQRHRSRHRDCGGGGIEAPENPCGQHVVAEEDRKVHDHAHHRGGDCGKRRGEAQLVMG